jgi:hypothetical protein
MATADGETLFFGPNLESSLAAAGSNEERTRS